MTFNQQTLRSVSADIRKQHLIEGNLKKQGVYFIYNISDPNSPQMTYCANDIDYAAPPARSGDIAPEGMVAFVQGKKHYLAVAMS